MTIEMHLQGVHEAIFLRDGRMVESLSRPEGLRAAYRRAMTGPIRS